MDIAVEDSFLHVGDATGLALPGTPEELLAAGSRWLTQAFRAFGSLAPDNEVTAITASSPCHDGNSGQKLLFSVDYARDDPDLHRDLFVKFSRDYVDAFRDRRKFELEAEVRLAALSRHPEFPVHVARPYFADFHHESGTGLLIAQRIRFGEDGLEPLHEKCMDHLLPNALEYYEATVRALADLAAAQKSGRLSPKLEQLFPYDRASAMTDLPIPWDEQGLTDAVGRIGDFGKRCPQLLPANVATPEFVARLEHDALAFLRHEDEVRAFLHSDPDFVALTHWNTNIDNAWFWRDKAGRMQCGLLDWGMVRQMNLAFGLWGGLSAATPEMLHDNVDGLLALFIDQLAAQGGPRLDPTELGVHFDLSLALIGLAMMMDLPALVLSRLPDVARASSPRDPLIRSDPVVRGFLHVTNNFLDLWERRDFGASLERTLARAAWNR